MRDWFLLAPVISMIEDMMIENDITTDLCSALTVDRAAHLLDDLGINVFDDDALFDYFAGFTAATSVAHALLHSMDTTPLHDDASLVCDAIIDGTMSHLLPLMPLLPQEAWPE